MSIKLMTQAWSLTTSNHTQKLILLKLADNASDEGVCWPSMTTIATQCQCDRRTVMRHITDLVNLGWLQINHRYKSDGSKNSNQYQLTLPRVVSEDHIGRGRESLGVGAEDHMGRGRESHKPSMNHQLEPSVINIIGKDEFDDLFDELWLQYPTKANKKKAKSTFLSYVKKHKLNVPQFIEQLKFDINKRCETEQFGFDKLHFTSYINGERWRDDYQSKQSLTVSPTFDFDKLKF